MGRGAHLGMRPQGVWTMQAWVSSALANNREGMKCGKTTMCKAPEPCFCAWMNEDTCSAACGTRCVTARGALNSAPLARPSAKVCTWFECLEAMG
mmetsp:Transcript_80248/g.221914  ORF Transcript_80248/g.221914 Transcript_80248/m.221914 type:complete len:95 (+) Transcript_80248:1293-1577(+)